MDVGALPLLLLALLWTPPGECYPGGAPVSACEDMTPEHEGSVESTNTSTYTIEVGMATYSPGQTLKVHVAGGTYKGVLLQARASGGAVTPVGTWSVSTGSKTLMCTATADSITHSSDAHRDSNTLYSWTAPSQDAGSLTFHATVVKEKTVWWKEESESITFVAISTGPSNVYTALQGAAVVMTVLLRFGC